MLKKFKFIISGSIIFIILFSLYFTIFLNEPEESNEIRINNDNNSIFNGYTPKEIAMKLALAAGEGAISLKYKEHHITTHYRYKTQYNGTIDIFLDEKELYNIANAPIILYSKINPGINISDNPSKGIDLIFGIWERFLDSLNYQLTESNYNISIDPYANWSGKVIIRQTCNDNIPLKNTGVVANIIEEDSRISTLSIRDWSSIKIEKNISISLDECENIIENETSEISINRSKLNFTGFIYFDENVYYDHNYEVPIEEVNNLSGFFRTSVSNPFKISENGTISEIVEIEYEQWVGYNFYVNVETNELTFSKYGISYLKK
jgi:hypothetical protein